MLPKTRAAIRRIVKDLKILGWCFDWGVHLLMSAYLTVALIFGWGKLVVNVILLLLTVAFLTVRSVERHKEVKWYDKWEEDKKQRRHKHLFQILSLLTKLFSLGVTVYGMVVSNQSSSSAMVVLTTLLIVLWFISAFLEIITLFVERESGLLLDGIYEDLDWVFRAARKVDEGKEAVEGFFHRFRPHRGKEEKNEEKKKEK